MVIRGQTTVTCPACSTRTEVELVQSINSDENPRDKERLLAGELNILDCPRCHKRTVLAANMLYRDPGADYYCQVVPEADDAAMQAAAAAFAAAGASGTQRLVPTQNALVEKVRILDAGLADWAVEMNKVLLLASLGELDRVLLFDARDGDLIHWILFDEDGRAPQRVSSPFASYDRLASRDHGRPKPDELRIDRRWAVDAVQSMITDAN
jgi:hypothetical protein